MLIIISLNLNRIFWIFCRMQSKALLTIWDSRTIMDDHRQMIKEFSSLVLNCFMYGIKVAFKVLQVVQARSHVDTIENWSKLIQKYIETHFRIWDDVFMGVIMDNQLWRRKASYVFWKYSSVGYSFQRNFHYWASSIDWITPRIKNWGYNVNGTIKVYNIYFRINEKALNISIIMIIRRWKIVNFIRLH